MLSCAELAVASHLTIFPSFASTVHKWGPQNLCRAVPRRDLYFLSARDAETELSRNTYTQWIITYSVRSATFWSIKTSSAPPTPVLLHRTFPVLNFKSIISPSHDLAGWRLEKEVEQIYVQRVSSQSNDNISKSMLFLKRNGSMHHVSVKRNFCRYWNNCTVTTMSLLIEQFSQILEQLRRNQWKALFWNAKSSHTCQSAAYVWHEYPFGSL